MKKYTCDWGRRLLIIFLFGLIICPISIKTIAEHREYDSEKFQGTISITANALKTIDLKLQEDKELEFIYSLQVRQKLPIDVWFMNDDNYNKFVEGGEFLYYIDGSQQNVTISSNIVKVKTPDEYKLVLANYNTQKVDIEIIYEIRMYSDSLSKNTSDNIITPFILFIFIIVVVFLIIILCLFYIKIRKLQSKPKAFDKSASKKKKKHKQSLKNKRFKHKSKKKGKVSLKSEHQFCGFCGKPVNTPFCRECGHEVN